MAERMTTGRRTQMPTIPVDFGIPGFGPDPDDALPMPGSEETGPRAEIAPPVRPAPAAPAPAPAPRARRGRKKRSVRMAAPSESARTSDDDPASQTFLGYWRDRHVRYLGAVSYQAERESGRRLNRSEFLRGLLDAVIEMDLDFSACRSDEDVAAVLRGAQSP